MTYEKLTSIPPPDLAAIGLVCASPKDLVPTRSHLGLSAWSVAFLQNAFQPEVLEQGQLGVYFRGKQSVTLPVLKFSDWEEEYYFAWETWVHRIGNLLRIEGEVCLWGMPEYGRDIKLGPWYYWRDEGGWQRCVRGSEAYRGAFARRIGDDFPFIQATHAVTQATHAITPTRHFKRRKD